MVIPCLLRILVEPPSTFAIHCLPDPRVRPLEIVCPWTALHLLRSTWTHPTPLTFSVHGDTMVGNQTSPGTSIMRAYKHQQPTLLQEIFSGGVFPSHQMAEQQLIGDHGSALIPCLSCRPERGGGPAAPVLGVRAPAAQQDAVGTALHLPRS